jgi:transcriptional regulator with XRE-family HTH domain
LEKGISERFRKRLRELRIQRGWTQEKAAEICEIGPKLFQLYELGIKPNPGLLTLEKIANGFVIEVHDLLGPALPGQSRIESQPTKEKHAKKPHGAKLRKAP